MSTKHKVVSREEWVAARKKLLESEKDLTRRSDEIAKKRQELPWVKIDKEYQFDTDEGKASLADLFRGRSQLVMYHFMFGPDYKAGCPSCSAIADGFNGIAIHLIHHDVMFWAVSRAPLAKLNDYKRRMGWTFPWASSFGSEFNFDFDVSFTEEQQRKGIEYNYRREPPIRFVGRTLRREVVSNRESAKGTRRVGLGKNREPREGKAPPLSSSAPEGPISFAAASGTDVNTYTRERPGVSAFALENGVVYHTYSAFSRGVDSLWGMYQWLDRAPKGRNEDGDLWWRRHDEYELGPHSADSCCH